MDIEEVGKQIVDSAYRVHVALGPGLLESVYQTCMVHELIKRGISVDSEVPVAVEYDGLRLDAGYRMDLLVEGLVVVEHKCVEQLLPVHQAQMITYLKLGGYQLGYLINWNVKRIKDGIHRFANQLPEPQWHIDNQKLKNT
jgi:GxxExxY protein